MVEVYEVRGPEGGPLPVVPVPGSADRWESPPAAGAERIVALLARHGPGCWRVQLFHTAGRARRCVFMAEREGAEPAGEYTTLAPGSYNLPGQPPVTVVATDRPANMPGEREAAANRYRRDLADASELFEPALPGDGRGVVVVGGGTYFPSAYVTIRVLRHIGCPLPVELWVAEGEAVDPPSAIDGLGVRVRVAAAGVVGFAIKPHAVLSSRFAEVLYLDADCYPLSDPSRLFDDPGYRRHGAAFWPDVRGANHWPMPAAWRAMGLEPPGEEPAFESGQFLVDRRRCWLQLAMTEWMCRRGPEFYYRLPGVWGDKDLFHFAWRLTRSDYAMPDTPWAASLVDGRPHTMLQHDFDRAVLFHHRARDKFALGPAVFTGSPQVAAANRYNPGLAHEDLCFDALADLAESRGEAPWPDRLAGVEYHCQVAGFGAGPSFRLRLEARGRLSRGGQSLRGRWRVEASGSLQLTLPGLPGGSAAMTPGVDGTFRSTEAILLCPA